MSLRHLVSVALALSKAFGVQAQASTPSVNPLSDFIGAAGSAVQIISSANAQATAGQQTSSVSPSALATTAPETGKSNSNRNLIITIVSCIVGSLLLIALIITCVCCCLVRRRRRARQPIGLSSNEEEKSNLRPFAERPLNPGRNYGPAPPTNLVPSMDREPAVPLLAANPGIRQHSTTDRSQNPFVPTPPTPRRQGYPNNTVTHIHPPIVTTTTTTSHNPNIAHRPFTSTSRSPSSNTTVPTPVKVEQPTALNAKLQPNLLPLSGIGRPYEDMHVHALKTDVPSRDLRESLRNREPTIQRYPTPPLVPSRSPRRRSNNFSPTETMPGAYHNSNTESSSSNNSSGSGEEWRRSQLSHRNSNPPIFPPPLKPWDHSGGHARRDSGGSGSSITPRSSTGGVGWTGGHERRGSAGKSPVTSNGQPRRLRFSELPAESAGTAGSGGRYGPAAAFGDKNDRERVTEVGAGELGPVYNAWDDGDQRYPAHMVGQAL
ncbi:hypothetical protein MMC31_003310 [Peltigera leucophlebia]|nr:hypothetical protein [Peltigera leucophlebia]